MPGGSLDSQLSDTQWVENTLGLSTPEPLRATTVDMGLGTRSQPYFVHSQTQEEFVESYSQLLESTFVYLFYLNCELIAFWKTLDDDAFENGKQEAQTCPPSYTANQTLITNVIKIINLCIQNAIEKQPKSQVEQDLEVRCLKLEAQIAADAARRDLLDNDLLREREWSKRLEESLRKHHISYPLYPHDL